MDPVTNFAKVTVDGVYDDDDTSIALETGHGARLPAAGAGIAFNVTWWNATDYPDPSDDPKKEIVRVTSRGGDTLTVTRAQEGTSASTKNEANKVYQMVLAPTKKTIDDIAAALAALAINFADNETPAGTINGVNTTFTLDETPSPASSLRLYLNGQHLTQGTDYTLTGATLTMIAVPFAGDTFKAFYRY